VAYVGVLATTLGYFETDREAWADSLVTIVYTTASKTWTNCQLMPGSFVQVTEPQFAKISGTDRYARFDCEALFNWQGV
jgi:hypothetical protein